MHGDTEKEIEGALNPAAQADRERELGLVAAAQGGDRDAFSALYEQNVDRVFRYLRSRVRNQADAEDLTAEVFLRAMKALKGYKPQGVPFIAWLLRIAHNTSVNLTRRNVRHAESELPEAIAGRDDPEAEVVKRMVMGEVGKAMEGLTDLQREVLVFRFGVDLSIAATAVAMNRSEDAVKFLQHSAVRALRRRLSPELGMGDHG